MVCTCVYGNERIKHGDPPLFAVRFLAVTTFEVGVFATLRLAERVRVPIASPGDGLFADACEFLSVLAIDAVTVAAHLKSREALAVPMDKG